MFDSKGIKFPIPPGRLVEHLTRKNEETHSIIVLPSIQRDAIWKPRQICELWDSLLCGIPIPALVLREVNSSKLPRARIVQDRYGQKQTSQVREGDYFLLDGHQRCMAVLSGYARLEHIRLWLDLDYDTESLDHRWRFFLCTKARPWGDRENFGKADPGKIRDARKMLYEESAMLQHGEFDFTIPLENTWPAHASTPLPFGELLTRINHDGSILDVSTLKKHAMELLAECKLPKTKMRRTLTALGELGEEKWELLVLAIGRLQKESIHAVIADIDDDDLLLAFRRLNQNGTELKPAELFFSGIKNEYPRSVSIDGALEAAKGSLFNDLDNLRGITVLASDGVIDGTVLDYDMLKQLHKGKKREDFARSFIAMAERSREWFANLKMVFDKIELPFVMRHRLNPRTWIPLLCWLSRFDDRPIFENALNTCSDNIQHFVLADHFFGNWKNEDKLLRAMIRKVKETEGFPRLEEFEALPEANDNWFQQVDFPVGPESETRLLDLPLSDDEMRIFIERKLMRDHWPLDVDGKLWRAGRWVDLLLWNQRKTLDEWFVDYEDEIKILGDEGRPWDHDHIVPYSFFYGYDCASEGDLKTILQPYELDLGDKNSLWDKFRSYRNHTGNYRVWPSGSNRSDQDCCARDKLDSNMPIKEPWIVLSDWWNKNLHSKRPNWLNDASAIGHDELWFETAQKSSNWGKQQLEAFIASVVERENKLYKNLFDNIKDSFSSRRFEGRI